MGAIEERLRGLDVRIGANHDSLAGLRGKVGDQAIDIAVMHKELDGVREDIAELRTDLKEQLRWVRRGLWVAASTFLMFVMALATLIFQAAGNG